MNLLNAIVNENYKITKIDYTNSTILPRLNDLGVIVGANITVVRECNKGACAVLLINGRLIAVSNEICKDIIVSGENNG